MSVLHQDEILAEMLSDTAASLGLPADATMDQIHAAWQEPDLEGSQKLGLPGGMVATRLQTGNIIGFLESAEDSYKIGLLPLDNDYNPNLKANIQRLATIDRAVNGLKQLGLDAEKKQAEENDFSYYQRVIKIIRENKGSEVFKNLQPPVILNEYRSFPENWRENEFMLLDVIESIEVVRIQGLDQNATRDQFAALRLSEGRAIFNKPDADVEEIKILTRQIVAMSFRVQLNLPDDAHLLEVYEAYQKVLGEKRMGG